MKQVVFLDRDGVINRDSPAYIKGWDEFEFIPKSLFALARLARAALPVVVITNQSAIYRGLIDPDTLADMHRRMTAAVRAAGGDILDIFFCPHGPDQGCRCRKPAPGMILAAAAEHRIDLAASVMVGDSAKDILCGKNAGCGRNVLVQTGDAVSARKALDRCHVTPDHDCRDLNGAVDWILHQCPGTGGRVRP